VVAQALGEEVGAFLKKEGHRWDWGCSMPPEPPSSVVLRAGGAAPWPVAEEGMQEGVASGLGGCQPCPARGQQEEEEKGEEEHGCRTLQGALGATSCLPGPVA